MIRFNVCKQGFGTLTLARPEKHNAMSDLMINEIRKNLKDVKQEKPRALFVKALGKSFSAGADLEWMKRAANYTREQNVADAMNLSEMLKELATLPMPTVALVQGNAYGGGIGLIAASDIAVSVEKANFTLSEVKLGLIPATISPYVVRRIGANQSRRYFLTAELFNSSEANRIGLLHHVVPDDAGLSDFEEHLKKHFGNNSPSGMIASKELIEAVEGRPVTTELMADTSDRLAKQRDSVEGKEGISAFLEKRKASFCVEREK